MELPAETRLEVKRRLQARIKESVVKYKLRDRVERPRLYVDISSEWW